MLTVLSAAILVALPFLAWSFLVKEGQPERAPHKKGRDKKDKKQLGGPANE